MTTQARILRLLPLLVVLTAGVITLIGFALSSTSTHQLSISRIVARAEHSKNIYATQSGETVAVTGTTTAGVYSGPGHKAWFSTTTDNQGQTSSSYYIRTRHSSCFSRVQGNQTAVGGATVATMLALNGVSNDGVPGSWHNMTRTHATWIPSGAPGENAAYILARFTSSGRLRSVIGATNGNLHRIIIAVRFRYPKNAVSALEHQVRFCVS